MIARTTGNVYGYVVERRKYTTVIDVVRIVKSHQPAAVYPFARAVRTGRRIVVKNRNIKSVYGENVTPVPAAV